MLRIIGSGFGRTGTVSLKVALEQLGFGPCYHMMEVFQNPEHVPLWSAAADGKLESWDAILGKYQSAIDWPSAAFWRELRTAYPDARVIHTERPEEAWYKSFAATIQEVMRGDRMPPMPGWADMANRVIEQRVFGGRSQDRDAVLDAYRRNNAAVRSEVPADRLLVFQPSDGWEPLCRFLGVPIPDTPYPQLNTTAEFRARIGAE